MVLIGCKIEMWLNVTYNCQKLIIKLQGGLKCVLWTNNNGCSYLKMIWDWEKDLSCTPNEKTWEGILSNTEEYEGFASREARSKFILYKIINRYYFTLSRLNSMGLITKDLCWKCKAESGTFILALWECLKILPLWKKFIVYISFPCPQDYASLEIELWSDSEINIVLEY